MIPFLFALCVPLDAGFPPLSDREKLPPLPVANDAIGFLIDQRYESKQQLAAEPGNAAFWRTMLAANQHGLEAWWAVLEALGGRDEEDGFEGGELVYRLALARLRGLLGEAYPRVLMAS